MMWRGYEFARNADDVVGLVLSYQVGLSVMGQVVGTCVAGLSGFYEARDLMIGELLFLNSSMVRRSDTFADGTVLKISESPLVNHEIFRNGREYSRKSDAGSRNGMESSHH